MTVFPGHQGDLLNNVYLVRTPEGFTVAHTGDQHDGEDFEWIDHAADTHRIDLLLMNCWTMDIPRIVRGFAPGVIITGHENEMGHSIDHREACWLTCERMAGIGTPWILMGWGESYTMKKAERG